MEHFHWPYRRYRNYRGYPWYDPVYVQKPVVIQSAPKSSYGELNKLARQPIGMSVSCLAFMVLVILMLLAYKKNN